MIRPIALILLIAIPLAAGEAPKPQKVPLPAEAKVELQEGVAALTKEIEVLKSQLKDNPKLLDLLPDIQVFANAVRFAIEDDTFSENAKTKKIAEIDIAKKLLAIGLQRAKDLRAGSALWAEQTGPVIRGYTSKLDATTIPYALVVPKNFKANDVSPHRLDLWLHGRDDTLNELKFIAGRLNGSSEFPLENGFVLHVYGRHCNAYKFAGEIDALEALAHAQVHYPIDANRIAIRGFSMGGAGTWHLAAHHAGLWAAANPGAGFVDVRNYLGIEKKKGGTPWYEEKLWHLYDALDYAVNLTNTTLVAYSGEIDAQKAAADLMEKALAADGVKMTHIIGEKTGHKYEPKAKIEVAKLVDAAMEKGRNSVPKEIRFTTFTLKYNSMHWVTIDALEKHWARASVNAAVAIGDKSGFVITTSNVNALTLAFEKSQFPFEKRMPVILDNELLYTPDPNADKSLRASFEKRNGNWQHTQPNQTELRKRHNLQGPIDDAFMDAFLFVTSSAPPLNEKIAAWTKSELDYARTQWRNQMRGEPREKRDTDITDADIAANNLILWGDPASNKILAKIADKLPIKWTAQTIEIGPTTYPADQYAPVLIYPNPLNPKKYIVLNSGFTFAEFAAASNAQQTPKLPDWAILDLTIPIAIRLKSGVKSAGFFTEKWELAKDEK